MSPNQKTVEAIASLILYGKSIGELEEIKSYILGLRDTRLPKVSTSAEQLAVEVINEALIVERALQVIRDAIDECK